MDWDGSSPQAGPCGSSPTVLLSRRGGHYWMSIGGRCWMPFNIRGAIHNRTVNNRHSRLKTFLSRAIISLYQRADQLTHYWGSQIDPQRISSISNREWMTVNCSVRWYYNQILANRTGEGFPSRLLGCRNQRKTHTIVELISVKSAPAVACLRVRPNNIQININDL